MITKTIVTNTLYQILTKFLTSGLGFLATILIARHFGVDGYGAFTQVTAYIALFYLIVDFGLNAIYIQKDQSYSYFRDLLGVRILFAFFLVIIVNLLAFVLPYNAQTNIGFSPLLRFSILVCSLTIVTQAVMTTAAAVFQNKLQYHLLLKANIAGSLITFVFVLLAILFSLSLAFLLGAFVIGGIVTGILAVYWTGQKIFPLHMDTQFIKGLVTESLPLGLMLIFNLIYFRSDVLLLSLFQSATDVGIYGLAFRFFDFLIALPLFLSNSLYTTLLAEQEFEKTSRKRLRYIGLFFFLGVLIVIPCWFFAPLITLVQHDFEPAILPFRVLLLSLPIFFMTNILQWVLITQKQLKYLMFVYGIATIANVFFNLLFIPLYSYMASAIITGVLEGCILLCLFGRMLVVVKKYAK